MKSLIALAFAGAFLLAGSHAQARTVVAGDSLCVGLAQASGLESVAKQSKGIRDVPEQLGRLPVGATVILCAGTNDASWRLPDFDNAVQSVIDAAKQRKQRLIWVGPISTHLWWDRYSNEADTKLALRFAPDYVSLRAIGWNRGEHDGQFHLTPKGYARLWGIVKEKIK
jgi:lysophospholipase L1-like esterase